MANNLTDVKFVAISRLTDRKTILAMNPHSDKAQYTSEVSHLLRRGKSDTTSMCLQFKREVTSLVQQITPNQVNSALKTGHWKGSTDSMQGTWYS